MKVITREAAMIVQAENDLGDMAEAFQDMVDLMSKYSEMRREDIDVDQIRGNLTIAEE